MNQNIAHARPQLTSPAFTEGGVIPKQYTCKGDNISPPLLIADLPEETKSLALIMHDPDAINGDFVHWIVWDISPKTQSINANSVPVGAVQGLNGFGKNSYSGPCPPKGTGTHRYIFELYAIDTSLGLDPHTPRERLEDTMREHLLAQSILTGLVKADS